MSVEYRSVLAQGWIVTNDEVRALDDQIYEALIDREVLICQDSWSGDSDFLYVFAGCALSFPSDDYRVISLDDLYCLDDAPAAAARFYELFPAHKGTAPRLIAMNVIY